MARTAPAPEVQPRLTVPGGVLVAGDEPVGRGAASPNFRIPLAVVDTGGGPAAGPELEARASVGQGYAGGTAMSTGFTLKAGFAAPAWCSALPLFADGFESGGVVAWTTVVP
jgi:hypothetical protein